MLRKSECREKFRRVAVFSIAVAAAALFAALPVTFDGASVDLNTALAVGNGNGNGGVGQGKGKGAVNGSLGKMSRNLGSLNSARANANAFANASPDSTIGKLAAAYGALQGYLDALNTLNDLQTQFDELSEADQLGAPGAALLAQIAAAQTALDTATTDAATALEPAANKDGLIDADVVDAVANLMDGKVTP